MVYTTTTQGDVMVNKDQIRNALVYAGMTYSIEVDNPLMRNGLLLEDVVDVIFSATSHHLST
jgi:hypothetical protein